MADTGTAAGDTLAIPRNDASAWTVEIAACWRVSLLSRPPANNAEAASFIDHVKSRSGATNKTPFTLLTGVLAAWKGAELGWRGSSAKQSI